MIEPRKLMAEQPCLISSNEKVSKLKEVMNEKTPYAVITGPSGYPVGLLSCDSQTIDFLYRLGGGELTVDCLPRRAVGVISEDENVELEQLLQKPHIVTNKLGAVRGVITDREIAIYLMHKNNALRQELHQVSTDLEAIMLSSDDLTCISDGSGAKVRISASCEKLYGLKPESLIGKNVRDLEAQGIYLPSATRLAIEQKKPVTITQRTKAGRKLLVTATPVFDKDGNITRVVSTSKDITDTEKLKQELEHLTTVLERYNEELTALRRANLQKSPVVGKSKAIEKVLELAEKVASVDSTVLIYGETGVGKEVIAKYIHSTSHRANGPFIKINCGAIPEHLLESELFGYEKGAFTGAKREGKPGLIEMAHNGTLFLDEVSELPLGLQVKLLRVLQEREIIRVGGVKSIKVDTRFIAASNQDLEQMVKQGRFRQDLYYRLNVVPIYVPPLRERTEDIPTLAQHFLEHYSRRYSRTKQFSGEVLQAILNYSWPGNVRELENLVERLVVTSDGPYISMKDLPPDIARTSSEPVQCYVSVTGLTSLKKATELVEAQLVTKAMEQLGSTYKAAKVLGINQSTVVRKLKKYGTLKI